MCTQVFFLSKFEFKGAGLTLKIRSKSPKSTHFFPFVIIMYLCQLGHIIAIGYRDRVHTGYLLSEFEFQSVV